jgi:hypothetical protein
MRYKKNGKDSRYSISDFKYDLGLGVITVEPAVPPQPVSEIAASTTVAQSLLASSSLCSGSEPHSRKAGLSRPDWPEWHTAELAEWNALQDLGCWVSVPISQVPRDTRIYRAKWLYKQKPDRKKARLVFLGNQQSPLDYDNTSAPVSRMETNRMLFAKAALNRWSVHLVDIQNAFINSALDKPLYMHYPEGYEQPGRVLLLKRALYGTKQAPNCWNLHYHRWLVQKGFRQSASDPCMYQLNRGGEVCFVSVYVDDNLIVGDAGLCKQVKALMAADYKVRDYGEPDHFLGLDFSRADDGSIRLSQSTYIRAMATRFDLLHAPCPHTPLDTSQDMTARVEDEAAADGTLYRSIVGSLLYAATSTRPDISYAVKELSRFLMNPSAAHLYQAKHCVSYLLGTHDAAITYSSRKDLDHLVGYSDADWASSADRKSTSGFIYFLAGGAVSWGAKQQKCVAHSSAESEYVALTAAGRECLWLRRIMSEISCSASDCGSVPTVIYEDNQACALWCVNPIQHARQKHIDIAHHAIREWVANGEIAVKYVSTRDQLADLLTKSLPRDAHRRMMYLIMGNNPDVLLHSQEVSKILPDHLYDCFNS